MFIDVMLIRLVPVILPAATCVGSEKGNGLPNDSIACLSNMSQCSVYSYGIVARAGSFS